jgi:hypothetical protein
MLGEMLVSQSSSARTLIWMTILFFLVGVFLFAVYPPPVHAAGLWVDHRFGTDTGNCTVFPGCKTIGYAISQASNGDSITLIAHPPLGPDVFTENLTINKSLYFIGEHEDPSLIVIDGNGGVTGQRVITVTAGAFVTMMGVTIRNGSAHSNPGGGIYNNGGNLFLEFVLVSGNSGTAGGGIYSGAGGTLTMITSTVKANNGHFGSGIYNNGLMTITDSTISGNHANVSASSDSGGIRNDGSGILTLTNVTISGNTSNTGGGGIANNGGSATLNNVTIAANIADMDNNGTGDGGGIGDFFGTIYMENTLLAGNVDRSGVAPDLNCPNGPPTSQGYNLIGNDKSCVFVGTTGDQFGTNSSPIDPMLGFLANYGGPAQTHALLVGSPAIDNGNPGSPDGLGAHCAPSDERGVTRPQGAHCDIGAFEGTVYPPIYLPLIMK